MNVNVKLISYKVKETANNEWTLYVKHNCIHAQETVKPHQKKSSQVAFNKKASDNRTSFTSKINENKIVKNQYTIK